jgi:O-antigen/teichoic acid export membrane protein
VERLNKNFLWLSAANIVSSVVNVGLFIYLARALEAESFGYFSYATTFVFYLFNFIDLGLTTYGIREVAKDNSRLPQYVSNILSFKSVLAVFIFLGFLLAVAFSCQPALIKILMAETALLLLVGSLSTEWAFQGLEKMHMVFISLVTTSFLQFGLTYMFVKTPQDLLKAPIVNFIAPIPILIIFLWILKFKFSIRRPELSNIKRYLSSSMAIWAISVFAQAYNGLDIVILGLFRSPQEVGYFTVARRIANGAGLMMIVLAGAVMPHLSATFVRDRARFAVATKKFLRISMFIVVLVFIPVIVFSKQLISLTVGPEYLQASLPLEIMMAALVLVMFNMPFSTGLIAAGFERDVMRQTFASASVSIVSNFILMPKYGMIGASVSFMLAESLALGWILYLYKIKIRKG